MGNRSSPQWKAWAACTKAGIAYALIVFLIGFGAGTIRVLLVAPRIGETIAVLLEAPVMLLASWITSRWATSRFDVPTELSARILMGMFAFFVLMTAELGVSLVVFGKSVVEHISGYGSIPGAIGLAAQLCFAGFPAAQLRRAFCGRPSPP